jgi:hypothetical protein
MIALQMLPAIIEALRKHKKEKAEKEVEKKDDEQKIEATGF